MEFALSDDQRLFQDSLRSYLDTSFPLDTARKAAQGDSDTLDTLAGGLGELGLSQMLVPETYGGLGLGLLDAALVQEMLGRSVAPTLFLAHSVMAVVGVLHAGTDDQKAEWLPKIAEGCTRIGIALTERVGARDGSGVTHRDGNLSGISLFALGTRGATHLLVWDKGGGLHLVNAADPGISKTELTTIDKTRDVAKLEFKSVQSVALGNMPSTGSAADRMIEAGRLMLAADTLGAADAMIQKAVSYALERKQFNRIIGSFQAVKHLCAEMAAHLEPARALVWHAAHARDEEIDEADVMICLAKAHLSEIGTFIARTAVEVHGGMGFTDLLGLHYWFKRIGANRQFLGGPEKIRLEAARLQGWA